MPPKKNNTTNIRILEPELKSTIAQKILELEPLRQKTFQGSTHERIFSWVKAIFHIIESVASARIEGNNTTVSEYLIHAPTQNSNHNSAKNTQKNRHLEPQSILEISNILEAQNFIEKQSVNGKIIINRAFISELHKIAMKDLHAPPHGEGDLNAGRYRKENVKINKSIHEPPNFLQIEDYMQDLFTFITKTHPAQFDLIKIAQAHHQFAWIHPFSNGNGRVVRLLSYAMLINAGFKIHIDRIINPTAIFCSDREKYYDYLAKADMQTLEGQEEWVDYFISGLAVEVKKVDQLLNYDFLKTQIIEPALVEAENRGFISKKELQVLKKIAKLQIAKTSDLAEFFNTTNKSSLSREISKLVSRGLIVPETQGGRKYLINLQKNYLLLGVLTQLDNQGFLPGSLSNE